MIGEKVYFNKQTNKGSYYSDSEYEWTAGEIVAVFKGGDLLIKDDDSEISREEFDNVAFTNPMVLNGENTLTLSQPIVTGLGKETDFQKEAKK